MCTLDKISFLLKQKHKTQKDLTDFLGLSKNTFTNWKSGDNESYRKYIDKIAEFFGVSTDYLLGVDETQKNPPPETEERIKELYDLTAGLSDEQMALLKAYVAGMKSNL